MKETKSSAPLKLKSKAKKGSTATDDNQAQQFSQIMELMKPVIEFLQPLEDASEDDLRLFWDIRLVRGKVARFHHLQGSSSLPAMLADNMVASASTTIQQEIHDKIMTPLVAVMQTAAEDLAFEDLANQERSDDFSSEEECFGEKSGEPFMPGETSSATNSCPQHVEAGLT
jgi:hypothetical protein